jgi:hypothetical protein
MPAARATAEAGLGRQHERRDPSRDLLARCFDELGVAIDATPEKRLPWVDREGLDDLPKLIAEAVALDAQKRRHARHACEPPVTGQHDTVLTPSRRQESLPGKVRPIENVAADDAEPPG